MNNILNCINYDILLEYLSFIKTGSFSQLKNYINNLDYNDELQQYKEEIREKDYDFNPHAIIFSMLSRLGHVEFDYSKAKFAICPATLVINSHSKRGILSGYRTRHFENVAKNFIKLIKNTNAPTCIQVEFDNIENFKMKFPLIRISNNFSNNLLHIVPTVNDYETKLQEIENPLINKNFVSFYNAKKYTFDTLRDQNLKNGLYEINYDDYNKVYYFFNNNKWYKIDKNYGKFLIHKYENNKNILIYNNKQQILYLNKYTRLPELIDRALTMCSGINPSLVDKGYEYVNIDITIAKLVAKILGQNLGV